MQITTLFLFICSTYKHIGRLRSARVIGRDLARFYMKLGEYRKAESFFLDLLRMYQASRWDRLTIAICKEMALCYQATGETHKYFKILTELASSSFCDLEMRKFYQKVCVPFESLISLLVIREFASVFLFSCGHATL